jgi:hypothetical protein
MKLKKPTLPIQAPFNMTKYLKSCFYFVPLVFALPSTAATTAIDDFSSLNLTGGSGDWINTWTNAVSPSSSNTISRSAATGALVATRGGTGTATNTVGSVSRQYTATTSVLLTISFDFTIGSFPTAGASGTGTVAQDRFELYGGSSRQGGVDASNSWMILGGQNLTGLQSGLGANWIFHNGKATGNFENGAAGENSLIDSGISLVLGNTYRFTILDNPSTASYIASVDNLNDLAGAFTTGSLGYRGAAAANPHIHFGARLSNATDTAGFTVDDVSIVPEPSSLLLSSIGVFALFRRRRPQR